MNRWHVICVAFALALGGCGSPDTTDAGRVDGSPDAPLDGSASPEDAGARSDGGLDEPDGGPEPDGGAPDDAGPADTGPREGFDPEPGFVVRGAFEHGGTVVIERAAGGFGARPHDAPWIWDVVSEQYVAGVPMDAYDGLSDGDEIQRPEGPSSSSCQI